MLVCTAQDDSFSKEVILQNVAMQTFEKNCGGPYTGKPNKSVVVLGDRPTLSHVYQISLQSWKRS